MTLGSSHFRDGETKLWTFSHLPKVTDSGRLEQQVSWAQAGCTHHFQHPHTCRSFTDQPLGPFRTGTVGSVLTSRPSGPHTEPRTRGSSHTALLQNQLKFTPRGTTAHSEQVGHGHPGQLAAMRAPGALHRARQSQDPNPAALPGQACCPKATLVPEPEAHTDTNTLPPQPYWLLPLIPRPTTAL